jgi:hypothetical protein
MGPTGLHIDVNHGASRVPSNGASGGRIGCVQWFGSSTGEAVIITQVVGPFDFRSDQRTAQSPVEVRGHPGQADQSSVTWFENGESIDVWILGAGSGGSPLTVMDLVGIVDSAP